MDQYPALSSVLGLEGVAAISAAISENPILPFEGRWQPEGLTEGCQRMSFILDR